MTSEVINESEEMQVSETRQRRWALPGDVVTGNGLRVAHIVRRTEAGDPVAETWCGQGAWAERTPESAPGRSVSWPASAGTPRCRRCVQRVERAGMVHTVRGAA